MKGISAEAYLQQVIGRELEPPLKAVNARPPLITGYGVLAKYGLAPSAEEQMRIAWTCARTLAKAFDYQRSGR